MLDKVYPNSEEEYPVSDIELNEELIAALDRIR